jgi:hypothetical protein
MAVANQDSIHEAIKRNKIEKLLATVNMAIFPNS